MALLAWLLFAAVLAGVWMRHSSVVPTVSIALYIFIPFVAGSNLTGGFGHPGTILVLVALAGSAIFRPKVLFREIGEHPLIYLSLVTLLTFLFVSLRLNSNEAVYVDTVLAPFALLVIIRMSTHWGSIRLALRNTLIAIAVAQVLLSVIAWITGRPAFFADAFARYYWFTPEFARGLGTTDHPLVLSLLLASVIPLLATLRSVRLQFTILLTLYAGLLLSESRTGLVAAVIGSAFLLLRPGRSLGIRATVIAAGLTVCLLLIQSPLGSGVMERFANDGGSSSARFTAIDAFIARASEFAVLGWGNSGGDLFRQQEGLNSSLESAFLIFAVNYGIPFAIGYFAIAVAVIAIGRDPLGGSRVAAITSLVMVQTFSSIATTSASAVLVWVLVALASLELAPARNQASRRAEERSRLFINS